MTLPKFAARRRGFTLIELLIVIVVIAILALIVIPKLMGAGRKAKDSTLRANLHMLRNSIEQYQADTGTYPRVANWYTDLVTDPGTSVVPAGTWKGPYLSAQGGIGGTAIPVNPYSTGSTATAHWLYEVSGNVATIGPAANTVTGNDASGVAYDTY